MDKNYIDDVEKYTSLVAVCDILERLEKKDKRYILSLLADYKVDLKELRMYYNFTKNRKYIVYLGNLVKIDYIKRVDGVNNRIPENLKTHLKTYLVAKYRDLIIRV